MAERQAGPVCGHQLGDNWCDPGTMCCNRSTPPTVTGSVDTERSPTEISVDDDIVYTTDPHMAAVLRHLLGPDCRQMFLLGVGNVPVGPLAGMFVSQYEEALSPHVPGLGVRPFYLMGHYDVLKVYRNYHVQPEAVILDAWGKPLIATPATITYLGMSTTSPHVSELFRMFSDALLVAGALGKLARVAEGATVIATPAAGIAGINSHIAGDAMSLKFQTVDQQVAFIVSHVPGADANQIRMLVKKAFAYESSVVIGGSRVNGTFRLASDLDVGFSGLTNNQAVKLLGKVTKAGPLEMESTRIIPGNATRSIPTILSPEEFFQRVGVRAANDGAKAGQVFLPSGSLTVVPGKIIYIPPGIRL